MSHRIFGEPNGLPNLLRHSSASSIHFEIPVFIRLFFGKEWKSESVQETWQRVVHWQQAWQVWLSIQFTGVRNGYGSTRWQPVETKRLVATDVHGPIHPKQMRTNLVGIAPCKRPMFCKVSASPSKTERFFRTRSATGNKVLEIAVEIGHGNLSTDPGVACGDSWHDTQHTWTKGHFDEWPLHCVYTSGRKRTEKWFPVDNFNDYSIQVSILFWNHCSPDSWLAIAKIGMLNLWVSRFEEWKSKFCNARAWTASNSFRKKTTTAQHLCQTAADSQTFCKAQQWHIQSMFSTHYQVAYILLCFKDIFQLSTFSANSQNMTQVDGNPGFKTASC